MFPELFSCKPGNTQLHRFLTVHPSLSVIVDYALAINTLEISGFPQHLLLKMLQYTYQYSINALNKNFQLIEFTNFYSPVQSRFAGNDKEVNLQAVLQKEVLSMQNAICHKSTFERLLNDVTMLEIQTSQMT